MSPRRVVAVFLARNREFVSRTGFRTDPPEPEQGEREKAETQQTGGHRAAQW